MSEDLYDGVDEFDGAALESPIMRFYRDGYAFNGYNIDQILKYEDEDLENDHNYIQLIFPLPEPSGHNKKAPILDRDDILNFMYSDADEKHKYIKKNPRIKVNASDCLTMMIGFFQRNRKRVMSKNNHNQKCITRMLKFFRIVGYYDLFYDLCMTICNMAKKSDPAGYKKAVPYWVNEMELVLKAQKKKK